MAPPPRFVGYLVGLLFLVSALAGCLASDDTSTGATAPPAMPEGAGWVRTLESESAGEAQLYGFDLDLHAGDWKTNDLFAETRIVLAPYGNLTGWALFLFDGGELVWEVIDLPYDVVDHETGERTHHEGAAQPRATWIFAEEPIHYHAVVALFGTGGLAIAPDPDLVLDHLPHADELLTRTTASPPVIGTGTGMAFDAYMDFTRDVSTGMRVIFGQAEATYTNPLPSDGASPLLDIEAVAPASRVGWASTVGLYRANHAQGTWEATIENDATHTFGGPIVQQRVTPAIGSAGEMVFGTPMFFGNGATQSATVSVFRAQAVGLDTRELFGLQQASFAVPLEHLIGFEAPPFEPRAFDGLLAPPHEYGYTVRGHDLVLHAGGAHTTLAGILDPERLAST